MPAKQGFDIYMGEPEQESADSYPEGEGTAFEDVYDLDTSALKSDLHFLLDFNTGNLTPHLQLRVPVFRTARSVRGRYQQEKAVTTCRFPCGLWRVSGWDRLLN